MALGDLGDVFSDNAGVPDFQRINIPEIQALSRQYALDNIQAGRDTLTKYSPDVLPTASALQSQARAGVELGGGLEASQQILNDFRLGGALPVDVVNQVNRNTAGTIGATGLMGNIPDLSQRDLGRTSFDLRDSRTGALQADSAARTAQGNLSVQNNPAPVTGLDPGQIASMSVSDLNALNAFNQQKAAIQAQNSQARAQLFSGLGSTAGSMIGQYYGGDQGAGYGQALGGAAGAIGGY